MGGIVRVAIFALLSLCRGVSSAAWTFGSSEAGSKHHHSIYGSVVKKGDVFYFHDGLQDGSVARAKYIDAKHTPSYTGQLHLSTSGSFSDHDQMFAAGYLEGYISAGRIHEYYSNTYTYFTRGMNASLDKPIDWLEEQDRWARSQVKVNVESTLWQMLDLVLAQFDGIVAGYQARHEAGPEEIPPLSRRDIIFLNGNGEVYDLLEAPELRGVHNSIDLNRTPTQIFHDIALSGRCSALITVTPDFSNLLMGHSTWDSWSQITKIFKHYSFQLSLPGMASQRMSFSSYPGELFSDDDLYIMDSKLAVLSTTNHLYNASLYDSLTHESLVSWQRVRVANALAVSGEEWVSYLDYLNSGTYNNQYMILDLKRFTPGSDLPPGLLWVAEQIPGLVASGDMTEQLARGYWPSYNVPYFPEVYNVSGLLRLQQQLAERGDEYLNAVAWMSYQLNPRASIFRRDASRVEGVRSMRQLMRSNNYQNDKLSSGSPVAAVCSRGDLEMEDPLATGCFDTKVTSYDMALRMQVDAVAGPTTEGGLPPFEWKEPFLNVPHVGMPQKFDFEFELQQPDWLMTLAATAA